MAEQQINFRRAAIFTAIDAPLEDGEIYWPMPLRYGQVLVKVLASGICGAQLSEIRGFKNPEAPTPRLMGHEAVVKVIECGPGVTKLSAGQKAVAHWRVGTGIECESPRWVKLTDGATDMVTRTAGRITTFAAHSVISENRLTPVPDDTPDELCCLLGCSLSTALGVIENEANVRFGESVLIIGCGGLGLNLILAAKLRQAGLIVVIEKNPEKSAVALGMGASSFHWLENCDVGAFQIGHSQFDVVIDTTGDPDRISHGIDLLRGGGRFVMVGQPGPGKDVVIPHAQRMFQGDGKAIMATQGGRFSPSLDIPRYIAMWRAGRLNLDGLISHRLPLSKINEGLDLVRNGMAGRVLIDCDSNE